jgi:hypothetical protein
MLSALQMAKHGIDVTGIEKRDRPDSRYQNASWRAYDTAKDMVDEPAFQELVSHRQRIVVAGSEGSASSIVTFSDRVQIVIGHAINTAIMSARRYGARLCIGADDDVGGNEGATTTDRIGVIGDDTREDAQSKGCEYDVCAVFCGARTSANFPVLDLQVCAWPHLESACKMWLQVQPHAPPQGDGDDTQEEDETSNSCTRHGEIGAERWDFTISSTRRSEQDLERILYNLDSAHAQVWNPSDEVTAKYREQRGRVESVLEQLRSKKIRKYEYIFTNSPSNEHNLAKRDAVEDAIVIDGGYSVPVQIATVSSFDDLKARSAFRSDVVVCGGDATVPPNPLAAYGATLACEAAHSVVQLAVAIGHLNAILHCMEDDDRSGWCQQVSELKVLFRIHYEARSRAENYFQFVQTLLCNLYSIPLV